MNRLKTRNFSFGPDVFRCVLLFLFICDYVMVRWIKNLYDFFALYTIIIWGGLLLLCDLLYKRSALKMKSAWILFLILALNAVTVLQYPDYIAGNTSNFITAAVFLLVLCPPGSIASVQNKCRVIFVFSLIVIIPVTIMTTISLWMQVTQFGYYADPVNYQNWIGHARGYRLYGIYGNSNIAGVFPLLAIAFLIIDWTLLKEFFNSKRAVYIGRIVIAFLTLLHMTMLTLSGSRASQLSLLIFVIFFSFITIYRFFGERLTSIIKRSVAAVMAAVVITGATYLTERPIRIGMAMMEMAVIAYRTERYGADATEYVSELIDRGEITGSPYDDINVFILDERDEFVDNEANLRLSIWDLSFEAIQEKPIFGTSPRRISSTLRAVNDNRPLEKQMVFSNDRIYNNAHNAYIQLMVTNGIPVLLLYLLFFILFIKRNLKALFTAYIRSDIFFKAGSLLALCAAIAFWNMFETELFFSTTPSALIFWSCMSFSSALLADAHKEPRESYFEIKRAGDIVLSFVGILILLPVFLILALAIKLDSKGPVFFKQKRIGIHKSNFYMLKFRTMRTDTPGDIPTHQLKDPEMYITKVGRFLRKTSLDELPQVFHVLSGKMSIIGPRPALWNQDDLVAEREKYGANDVRPGLGGWAQVNGRDELPIPVKARFDGEYVQNIGFLFDCKCFFMTISTALKAKGVVEGGTGSLERKQK